MLTHTHPTKTQREEIENKSEDLSKFMIIRNILKFHMPKVYYGAESWQALQEMTIARNI